MMRDITLGQYFEGNSILHRLDPRTKLILTACAIVAVFLAKSATAFLLLGVIAVCLAVVSRIPFKMLMRSLRPLIFVLAFTTIFNIFWHSGETLLVQFWGVRIYLEGILFSLMIVIRIVILLMLTTVLLTYTTTPIALTDGIEQMFSPLKKIKLPVHEFAMMMTIALRFIPTLIEEMDKLMNAQRARGADFSSGGLIRRAKALLPIIVPLVLSSFRRADELATAMECRCYRGGEGRTRMTKLTFHAYDGVAIVLMLVLVAAVILLNIFYPFYLF